ncbi:MAG TPA: acetoin utilization protein [Rhizobiales bacterium]|jgi:acetoin utilization deacetylase AcuC-like enzyme|nr:acetoin utilization protein [Hyphomicrobiales bacterium]HAN62410.1 acetoin utilization protein [Hyphomicrobiales bacterium]HBH41551.1 acetoin utilization protein [Hyphomicrobiales bacterium]HBR27016.1 acetoin utilization protein [Hyphomicrobiales bacterium]HCL61185.1 acetoin utilization protein [Hyphomicrobiales bacterium]
MTTLLLTHPDCLLHDTGFGHPERADRLRAIESALEGERFHYLMRETAPLADLAVIERLHPKAYVEMIRAAIPKRDHNWLDPDTVVSPGSWDAALRATGAAIYAVDQVMAGAANNAFCAVRPPGHHAEPSRAMGFCLFNTVAVATLHARAVHGASRVAVVDVDVHHGNGTQEAFWSDKDLFYGSTHQMPLFPGTGALDETGAGNIFNVPLKAGDDGEDFREAFATRILPALDDFAPDFLLVSAGFDAHIKDPLAQLRLVEADFAWVTEKLLGVAAKHTGGKLVSTLEGGYDLDALASSTAVHVETLMGS